ncbi:hypothetical protein, partial [Streptomyces sp. SID2119]|uniref:hypothetical protein n=1 Tax=Streptomyces sp. SID2119 TaxID=2690253 RepID=UPI001F225C46
MKRSTARQGTTQPVRSDPSTGRRRPDLRIGPGRFVGAFPLGLVPRTATGPTTARAAPAAPAGSGGPT